MYNGYQIHDQSATYYLTFQIVEWVDVFTRPHYKQIVTSSFDYCRKQKGLSLYAYVIMTNHIHLIAGTKEGFKLSDTIRDFKKFTANQLLGEMKGTAESRKDLMLKRFEFAANKHTRNSNYQVWTHENHPVELYSKPFIEQKLNYIHQNPVRAGIVLNPVEHIYSSTSNYANKSSVLDIDLIWQSNRFKLSSNRISLGNNVTYSIRQPLFKETLYSDNMKCNVAASVQIRDLLTQPRSRETSRSQRISFLEDYGERVELF